MRADFTLFDEYQHRHTAAAPFDIPVTAFWGNRDRRIKQEMVQGWSRFTTGPFQLLEAEGHHLWPLDKACKGAWLQVIADQLAALPI